MSAINDEASSFSLGMYFGTSNSSNQYHKRDSLPGRCTEDWYNKSRDFSQERSGAVINSGSFREQITLKSVMTMNTNN